MGFSVFLIKSVQNVCGPAKIFSLARQKCNSCHFFATESYASLHLQNGASISDENLLLLHTLETCHWLEVGIVSCTQRDGAENEPLLTPKARRHISG